MNQAIRGTLLAVTVAAFPISTACTGTSEALTVEEYFQRVRALFQAIAEGPGIPEEAIQRAQARIESATSEEESLEAIAGLLDLIRPTLAGLRADLDDLQPPRELAELHDELLLLLDESLAASDELTGILKRSPDSQEAFSQMVEYATRFQERQMRFCRSLEAAVEENHITWDDLSCDQLPLPGSVR